MYNCHMIIFFKPNMASLHISIHVKFKKLKNRKNYNEDRTSLSLIICRGIIYHVFYMYFIFKSYLTCTQVYSYPLYYSKKIKSYHFSKKKKIKKICFLNMVSLIFLEGIKKIINILLRSFPLYLTNVLIKNDIKNENTES